MNITEFLKARIEEDEQRAHTAIQATTPNWASMDSTLFQLDSNQPPNAEPIATVDHHHMNESLPHIEHWDPSRALAECAAKRAIIADWEDAEKSAGNYPTIDAGYALGLEVAVQHLAATYSNHPDYNQEWRPTN